MKKLILIIIAFALIGCAQFDKEYDFRNYLRDQHPYSEIINLDTNNYATSWHYIVNDTINDVFYVYEGDRHGFEKYDLTKYTKNEK